MTDASSIGLKLTDLRGFQHELTSELGRGGQGVVYRTRDPNTAIKLLLDAEGRPLQVQPNDSHPFRKILDRLLTLPLPEHGIALPIVPLAAPYVGYTMRLLRGMVPIAKLLTPTDKHAGEFYCNSGGLWRRLRLLAQLADLMAELHAIPLTYCDLSSNNVFISESVDSHEVWLIDADNLHYTESLRTSLHTPRFAAPEVATGRTGANTLSDCWSFAVLAHMVLRMVHPFEGALIAEGGWDASRSCDYEREANEGRVPWIDDLNDRRNASDVGVRREDCLSAQLRELFSRNFSDGLTNPSARPSMQEWSEALWNAHDQTLRCASCKSTFFASRVGQCSFCTAVCGAVIRVESRVWVPDLDDGFADLATGRKAVLAANEQLRAFDLAESKQIEVGRLPPRAPVAIAHFSVGEAVTIPVAFVRACLWMSRREPALELRFRPKSMIIESVCESSAWRWSRPDTDPTKPHPPAPPFGPILELLLPQSKAWLGHLHCGSLTESHRVLSFAYLPGGAVESR